MKKNRLIQVTAAIAATALLACPSLVQAGNSKLDNFPQKIRGAIIIPESSIEKAEDIGKRYHTNHMLMVSPDAASPQGETPASIRSVYNLPSTGGSGTIAIVIAYDYGTALNDFNVFSQEFGLPKETSNNVTAAGNQHFQIVYASGSKPAKNASWNQEAALDIEWSHAMAPNAKIVLVECASNSLQDLGAGVLKASSVSGVKEVSMSFGGSEFNTQVSQGDPYFATPGVVYLASSGDTGGKMSYPASSVKVVSVGGTKLNRNGSGVFTSETGWSGSGGGPSVYSARPTYQNGISSIVGTKRGVPDLSLDGDPNSGVSVYCSTAYLGQKGWLVFGGTSVSCPCMAGIVNLCSTLNSNFAASSTDELTRIYGSLGTADFRDITSGTAGSFSCLAGWDFVTGVGSTITTTGK